MPFDGIAGFNSETTKVYDKTLFRLPLRTKESKLSSKVYTLDGIVKLIEALKCDAKVILLFLQSVTSIEVYNIDSVGNSLLLFQTEVEDNYHDDLTMKQEDLTMKREDFATKIRLNYEKFGYKSLTVNSFEARFDVSVFDSSSGSSITPFLLVNQVGSNNHEVITASDKQKVFPWVGAAIDLKSPGDGRICCFLPIRQTAHSNLPIHIHGTFGLDDKRHNLKWPSSESKNDPVADWNCLLIKELLPSCYVQLLLAARKYFSSITFYELWPNIHFVKRSEWHDILKPLFYLLFQNQVVLSKTLLGHEQWLLPNDAIYFSYSDHSLKDPVLQMLCGSKIKLAEVTSQIQDAFQFMDLRIKSVTPKITRICMKRNKRSYSDFNIEMKFDLLKYILSDSDYEAMDGIVLLPLANERFISFSVDKTAPIYLCTKECPRSLLPNLDDRLVDVTIDAEDKIGLLGLAKSNQTQLKVLSIDDVAKLIEISMPKQWQKLTMVQYPWLESFPSNWFDIFWDWVKRNKSLVKFKNKLIVPIEAEGCPISDNFSVIRLDKSQAAIYFPSYQARDSKIISILNEYDVKCCFQRSFSYLSGVDLSPFIAEYSVSNMLKMISMKSNYDSVLVAPEEAKILRKHIGQTVLNIQEVKVLRKLKIFETSANTKHRLFSIHDSTPISLLETCLLEPPNLQKLVNALPSNIILFSRTDNNQVNLLKQCKIQTVTDSAFITFHILPSIKNEKIGEEFIDRTMVPILDSYLSRDTSIIKYIKSLQFVKDGSSTRKSPTELFNPKTPCISEIFKDQCVFPAAPYDKYIEVLRLCGLKDCVTGIEIFNVILSISKNASKAPQAVSEIEVTRARAVLKYIQTKSFKDGSKTGSFKYDQCVYSFEDLLLLLSKTRNWLPVLHLRPDEYPACLPWKGTSYTSHLISLCEQTCVSCSSFEHFPILYGSQALFTDPVVDLDVYKWLGRPEPNICLCPHFFQVISTCVLVDKNKMIRIVLHIYDAMLEILEHGNKAHIDFMRDIKDWIYIYKHNSFVSIQCVAKSQNPTFQHNLEPYLYILSDSNLRYSSLFKYFGMSMSVSSSQILSILNTIKLNIDKQTYPSNSVQVWDTVMAILQWLANNITEEKLVHSLLVPAESLCEWPDLRKGKELVYVDNNFLKQFTQDSIFVHNSITPALCKSLKLTPLSQVLDVSEDTVSDAGQYETIILRIKNILEDYKDGITIIKELIQNADDAEATQINICYDARTHEVNKKCLLFPNMLKSYGPALIVHNNKTFSDEDFMNIQKLAAATKQKEQQKIGKFGLGFCSVYHITDVPSFISRDRMYIFDPTLQHIGGEINTNSSPGKKVMFLRKVVQKSAQLTPYEGLFNFHSSKTYQGTIFRFPFRTSSSELSNQCYTVSDIKELLDKVKQNGNELLVFLQHVQKITVQCIQNGDRFPKVLFEVSKSKQDFSVNFDHRYLTIKIEIEICDKTSKENRHTDWMVIKNTVSDRNGLATASVACNLYKTSNGKFSVKSDLKGGTFCYLPLSQSTGLPIHVSCNFAVISNRKGIWTSDEATKKSSNEVQWNVFLMTDVIPSAYIGLLSGLRILQEHGLLHDYSFYCLWPVHDKLESKNPWKYLVSKFYEMLSDEKVYFSDSTHQWLKKEESIFLSSKILGISGENQCVSSIIIFLKLPLVKLPDYYRKSLHLHKETITEERFIQLFFKNFSCMLTEKISHARNDIVICMLNVFINDKEQKNNRFKLLKAYLKTEACIPCLPDGSILHKCNELICPKAPFCNLFNESDGRFPLDEFIASSITSEALKEAGMMHHTIPWELIIERAQMVKTLYHSNQEVALERVKLILYTIANYVNESPPTYGITIESVKFLPVLASPTNYPINWKGSDLTLECSKNLMISQVGYLSDKTILAGSQVTFVSEFKPQHGGCGRIPLVMRERLHFRLTPTCREVIQHLLKIVSSFSSEISKEWITEVCKKIYEFLDLAVQNEKQEVNIVNMLNSSCIWNGTKFLNVNDIANNWKYNNGPYLFSVPPILADKMDLIKALNVKSEFLYTDAQVTLHKMKMDFGVDAVDTDCFNLIIELISIFSKSLLSKEKPNLWDSEQVIYLPDEGGVLHISSELAYNDVGWAPQDRNFKYVNKIVARELALALGVRLVRSKMLDKYVSNSTPFGQSEKLIDRIQNILRDYPYDITILKELLQNSDDSRAKKMYVILDKRTHGSESLISKKWKALQGPALLVWNDSVFSEHDLEGIQALGLGNKRSNSEAIGQYGIGFNVVYHLTNCPSFITGGKTLCIFDPLRAYTETSSVEFPGERYDKLNEGFWDDFSDMSSSYLLTSLEGASNMIQTGSLFRFPIRHSHDTVNSSLMSQESTPNPLTVDKLMEDIRKWMPNIKNAMFFLNNVTEIKYMEIEPNGSNLITIFHYQSEIPDYSKYVTEITAFRSAVSNFSEVSHSQSCNILHPIIITEHRNAEPSPVKENWLIQKGVGDTKNKTQQWKYDEPIKPIHGIAANLNRSKYETGQMFCFLPLPAESSVPVHVNGNFILDSTRRDIWKATDPNEVDSKSRWNMKLLLAISSSYADFLINSKTIYLRQQYSSWPAVHNDLRSYFNVFPRIFTTRETKIKTLSRSVLNLLIQEKANILCVFCSIEMDSQPKEGKSKRDSKIVLRWHPVIANPEDQVYFWGAKIQRNLLHPILERLGMNITPLQSRLRKDLNMVLKDDESEVPEITPESVFLYYTKYSCLSSDRRLAPMLISDTKFQDVPAYIVFIKYLTKMPLEDPKKNKDIGPDIRYNVEYFEQGVFEIDSIPTECKDKHQNSKFPESPFSHYLLLSADERLRFFHPNKKAFRSNYHYLFPKHKDLFLHPELFSLLDSTYFISKCSSEDYDECDEHVLNSIMDLFQVTLPRVLLMHPAEQKASAIIDRETLKKLWECFKNDEVFRSYLPHFLKKVALLLTTDDRLFSTSSDVLPICPSQDFDNEELTSVVWNILEKLKLPILDISVVCTKVDCPTLGNHSVILKNLVHINTHTSLTSVLSNKELNTLISYFASKLVLNESVVHIKSLPFFEDLNGNYKSILNKKAYIWPNVCMDGYKTWCAEESITFVMPHTSWTSLGSSEQLSICDISMEEIYNDYVFPHFSKFDEEQQYNHLIYIRDCWITDIEFHRKLSQDSTSKMAKLFLDELISLRCIKSTTDFCLHPISSFCDYQQKIFQLFSEYFQTLPECFKTEEWMKFFRILGLKQNLNQKEYLHFCHEIANGKVDNVSFSSLVLLDYLFFSDAAKQWRNDKVFLAQVSTIQFVPRSNITTVNWIVPGKHQNNVLVQLDGSAPRTLRRFIWTVRPIVELPVLCILDPKNMSSELQAMLKNLGLILEPSFEDVTTNIKNISKSAYSNSTLFGSYPEKLFPSKGCNIEEDNLITILKDNFLALQGSKYVDALSALPCIPVFADILHEDYKTVALVKPCSVISEAECYEFFPFLHSLPLELRSLESLFNKIGVKSRLSVCHIQMVLSELHVLTCGLTLNPNSKQCVKNCIIRLSEIIKPDGSSGKDLQPLYLPNTEGVLVLSTELLYGDIPSYFDCRPLDLKGTKFHHFDIKEDDYGTDALDLSRLLPDKIKPLKMSVVCKLVPNSDCILTEDSDLAIQLIESFRDPTTPVALVGIINRIISKQSKEEEYKEITKSILLSIEASTVFQLKAKIVLLESNLAIGEVTTEYFFSVLGKNTHLYIDRDAMFSDDIVSELSEFILKSMTNMEGSLSFSNKRKLLLQMDKYLKGTPPQKRRILEQYLINAAISSHTKYDDLGEEIPLSMHCRLDQSPNNIFSPMEYVGYEMKEKVLIIAQVVHRISIEDESELYRQYRIYVSKDDDEGQVVSTLEIYKFLIGDANEGVSQSTALVRVEESGDVLNITDPLDRQKSEITKLLENSWKLDHQLRHKAIRRLFLKYHPDKNLNNHEESEALFEFLASEIERLEYDSLSSSSSDINFGAENLLDVQQTLQSHNKQRACSRYYSTWHETARSHHKEHQHTKFLCPTEFENENSRFFPLSMDDIHQEDPCEGWRWVNQAEVDLEILENCLKQADSMHGFGNVCFLAHQVAEKSLKGGLYALCGPDGRTLVDHNLTRIALSLESLSLKENIILSRHSCQLESYYLDTRYPNRWPNDFDIPSSHYQEKDAIVAAACARRILHTIKSIMPENFKNT